ncbi:hypothetical protein K435DRAFT_185645 [Dendrothele bispora CBS 962.96]|uniref:Uncharacterized protein n=1 Tax=Dendrothele bispora (strain CBS 962.96) TaxID=1314807 RepID=A0A4S8KKZ2_DENBC|nr:hypothetical protein K435DRAFT_185645 [Dendrothele bispora CBS 962.96]
MIVGLDAHTYSLSYLAQASPDACDSQSIATIDTPQHSRPGISRLTQTTSTDY